MNNNHHWWSQLMVILNSWWQGETPLGAVIMSIFMATLRIAYNGGGVRKMILESLLCGALTLTLAACLDYFSLPRMLSVAIGGGVGFIGIHTLRSFMMKIIRRRFGVDKK